MVKKSLIIIFIILLADQVFKIWIKTHMYLGEEYNVFGNWFLLHFTENNGMAFGMEFAGSTGKIALSIFRIFAVGGIGYLIGISVKKKENFWVILSWSLIFAGAMGNIIDSCFYGMIFDKSGYFPTQVAQFMPPEGGYSDFLHGKVVDMLYFPLIDITPQQAPWLPNFLFGDDGHFLFFRPVFNIADTSISLGVILLLVLQFFGRKNFFVS